MPTRFLCTKRLKNSNGMQNTTSMGQLTSSGLVCATSCSSNGTAVRCGAVCVPHIVHAGQSNITTTIRNIHASAGKGRARHNSSSLPCMT
jgi:hypothetical protein